MMKRKKLRVVSAALVLCAAATFGAPAEAAAQTTPARAASVAAKRPGAEPKLTPEEERLVRDSKAAIIETGFSEGYFDAHFKPVKVHNSPGDRRVVWRFRLDGYETTINDSIGFYTDARGRRVDSHMVGAALGRTRDIRRTISFRRARRAMKACIGEYSPGSILLQRFDADGRVSLVFTAVSLPPPAEPASAASAGQPTPPPPPAGPQRDGPKPGGKKKKPFLKIGSIDLETGRCTKGVAQVGSPQPPANPQPAPKPAPRPR
ncbi:MAG: hypothetical protein LC802_06510 [Acidobacteria bacterium]|nr:hypothetical protein [Acidobacteriota bacterium]